MDAEIPFPLVSLMTPFLRRARRGRERYRLVEQAEAAITLALDALFSSGATVLPALDELYGLSVVLEEEQGSLTAALRIRAVLDGDPRVVEAYGLNSSRAQLTERSFQSFNGEARVRRAPKIGQPGPKLGLELRQLGRGFDRDRARAQASAKGGY